MAINFASKYSAKVDERFASESITGAAVNNDYDWDGVKTVNVYSIGTAPLNDYKMTGLNRYGDPEELGDSVQTMTLSQDKSFTYTIDRKNYTDTQMTKEAGKSLSRQTNEVLIPYVDGYRIAKMANYAGKTDYAEITKENAYEEFMSLNTDLEGPEDGRLAYVTAAFYKAIKLDDNFIKKGDMSQEMLVKGVIGEVDGVQIKVTNKLPTHCNFVITHSIATVAPTKLETYKIHEDAPGIDGWLVEGRIYFDAFVLDNKKNAIGSHWDAQANIPETAGVPVTPPENIPNVDRTPSIHLNKTATTLATTTGTEDLIAIVENADDATITWASSDTTKATVSNKGKVTGKAAGTSVITATITVDSVDYNAACTVTIPS